MDVRQLLSSPDCLLHHVDVPGGWLTFLPTSAGTIRASSFIDGRTPIAAGVPIGCGLTAGLKAAAALPRARRRFVFHIAFCGSTLLSRLLDVRGRTLVLREPNALVELADWKAAAGGPDGEALAGLACASLFCAGWEGPERVVVKPSNWVNNLLPELTDEQTSALFMTMPVRPFLRAVFRGGRDRLAFAGRAAAHLAAGNLGDEAMLGAAASSAQNPLGKVAAFAALLHHMQLARFRQVMVVRGWSTDHVIDFGDLARWPIAAAHLANAVLDLGLAPEELSRSVRLNGRFHAKDPAAAFEAEALLGADRAVEAQYGAHIDRALAWARDTLPAIELPAPPETAATSAA